MSKMSYDPSKGLVAAQRLKLNPVQWSPPV